VGERRNLYRALVGKPEGNILVLRPGNRLECNIKVSLKEIRLEGLDWIFLVEDRYMYRVLKDTR
jgi:hypothetical protein